MRRARPQVAGLLWPGVDGTDDAAGLVLAMLYGLMIQEELADDLRIPADRMSGALALLAATCR